MRDCLPTKLLGRLLTGRRIILRGGVIDFRRSLLPRLRAGCALRRMHEKLRVGCLRLTFAYVDVTFCGPTATSILIGNPSVACLPQLHFDHPGAVILGSEGYVFDFANVAIYGLLLVEKRSTLKS